MERDSDIGQRIGQALVDREGETIGPIQEIFLDADAGDPKWAAVASGERESQPTLVPLMGADEEGDGLRVAILREQVLTAPEVSVVEGRISPEQEDVLERHYTGAVGRSGVGDVEGNRKSAVVHDDLDQVPVLTRSEEELVVDTRRVERERVRLVKRVVTETITRTVEIRREELHVERIPLRGVSARAATAVEGSAPEAEAPADAETGSSLAERLPGPLGRGLAELQRRRPGARHGLTADGEPFSDESVDVTLFEEEIVISKRVVPRERVRLGRVVTRESRELHEELRKERVELKTPDEREPVARPG